MSPPIVVSDDGTNYGTFTANKLATDRMRVSNVNGVLEAVSDGRMTLDQAFVPLCR
jgi:hypothetical protein